MLNYHITFERVNEANFHNKCLLRTVVDGNIVGDIYITSSDWESEVTGWDPVYTPLEPDLSSAIRADLRREAQRQGHSICGLSHIN